MADKTNIVTIKRLIIKSLEFSMAWLYSLTDEDGHFRELIANVHY